MDSLVKEQIISVQKTGKTNMFDKNKVQIIANKKGFSELVFFIEESPREYFEFILSGTEKGKV